ncbi:hypothetical protein AYO44_13425 [Planctomycetaceae bacterium SCGC AG-212-F19]|nr:hypothetical protein AYO44_13425 [Planctomycetaceae bacterium SCGC AG-212-F19]
MRQWILSTILLVGVTAGLGKAGEDGNPESPANPALAHAVTPPETNDAHPWNPEVAHGNEWPYKKPVHIDAEFYGPPGEFWLGAEYLLWRLKGASLPPLVTTGPAGSNGILGQPGVTTLFGASTPDINPFSGARITAGLWFDSAYTLGLEGNYFFLAQRAVAFTASSAGSPVLARPFINASAGVPDGLLLASPGVGSGSVQVQAPTELQGAEANLVWNLRRGPALIVDLLAGVRYLDLGSDLNVIDATSAQAGAPTTLDQFTVHNHFYGGQLGGRVDYRWRCLVFGLTEKVALGASTADIKIAGTTVLTSGAGVGTQTAIGLLAQPSNIGRHSDDTFAVINEIGVQAGWQINDYLKAFAGYTFLYVSSVVRAGDMADLTVNPSQATGGPARPAFTPHETGFWGHGLNAGLELRY